MRTKTVLSVAAFVALLVLCRPGPTPYDEPARGSSATSQPTATHAAVPSSSSTTVPTIPTTSHHETEDAAHPWPVTSLLPHDTREWRIDYRVESGIEGRGPLLAPRRVAAGRGAVVVTKFAQRFATGAGRTLNLTVNLHVRVRVFFPTSLLWGSRKVMMVGAAYER